MPAGIVLAGGRSSRMGTPKAWLDWHGSTLLRGGRAGRRAGSEWTRRRRPGRGPRSCRSCPAAVEVVEDAREGQGPLQGLLAGLEAVDAGLAFVASTDMPFLHPQFVAAVCGAARDADAAVPYLRRLPSTARGGLPNGARAARAGARRELGRMKSAFLFERCEDPLARRPSACRECPEPQHARGLRRRARGAAADRPRPLLRPTSAPAGRRARGDLGRGRRRGRRRPRRARARSAQRRPDRPRPARAARRG